MYSSYYSSAKSQKSTNKQEKARKSTPQYLFLNIIRMFSIAYLLLTVFYIPVYIGIGQIHSLYFQEVETDYTYFQKTLLQGTIFAIRNHQTCYPIVGINATLTDSSSQPQQSIYPLNQTQVCYKNKLQFLPFVNTVEDFHNFYFYFFIVLYFLFFISILAVEYMNLKLYVELQYPNLSKTFNQKLQNKKVYHVSCQVNWPIYMLKPLLISKIQKELQIPRIKNIKTTFLKKFHHYASLHITLKNLQIKINNLKDKLSNEVNEQTLKQLTQNIMELKQKYQKIGFEMTHLERKLQKILRTTHQYHYNHFWVHFQSLQDVLKVKQFIKNQQKIEKSKQECFNNKISLKFDEIQQSDLIVSNVENREIIYLLSSLSKPSSKQQISQFHPNKNYKYLNSVLRVLKVISGIILCLILVVFIDILILIIQKNKIFSYATVLVVLVIEIILKLIIVKLSQLQRHSLYSNQKLSIMLKLTLLIFFNLAIMLFIGNHDLGSWEWGKTLSTYEFSSINNQWFLQIGTSILVVVLIQLVFCNLRVYIEVFANILLLFVSRRTLSLIKLNKIRERINIWMDDFRLSYKKPVIDLEICYSQILPIYMLGLTFSYLFPVLYPLLFIFSITINHTHKNYIELYTDKMPFSKPILNNWAYFIIYATFIGGIFMVYVIESMNYTFLFVTSGLVIVVAVFFNYFLLDLDRMIIQRLEQLVKIEKKLREKQRINEVLTQRMFIEQNDINENSQENSPQILRNEWISSLIDSKKIETTLLKLFNSKSQNLNQIHAEYYSKYSQILNREMNYLISLTKRIQKQTTKKQ